MAQGTIYRKTQRGAAEVRERKMKLNPRVRTMLILVDGTLAESALREGAARVGAPDDFLQQLLDAGLIEMAGGAGASAAPAAAPRAPVDDFTRFREAKDFMNSTVVDALGIKSFFFTMKLERAAVVADLRDLVAPYRDAIAKARGEEEAEVMGARLTDMLG